MATKEVIRDTISRFLNDYDPETDFSLEDPSDCMHLADALTEHLEEHDMLNFTDEADVDSDDD